MATSRDKLLESIAEQIADYREGEVTRPTAGHVDRWIRQFDCDVQDPLLQEVAHMLRATYFTKKDVASFFRRQIKHQELAGQDPCAFWRSAQILDIQQQGNSQTEIRELFGKALSAECPAVSMDQCGAAGGAFIYLDDVLFSGSRIGGDLAQWIKTDAPANGTVEILCIAAYLFGEWKCSERLREEAKAAGKQLRFRIWAALRLENRLKYHATSEVLWPAVIPNDATLKAYMAGEKKFPFKLRTPNGKLEHALFTSEEGRQLVERELLMAGMRIRSFCQNPSRALRPLGFSPFGLGFGSTIVTYRNCPNNAPLALWWGDPEAPQSHPFSKWYPLVPRKTYGQADEFDGFF